MDADGTFTIDNVGDIAANSSDIFRLLNYNSSTYGGDFEDYVETTVHPGAPLFIGVLIFQLASQALVPLFVANGDERYRLRKLKKLRKEQERHDLRNIVSKTPPRPFNGDVDDDVANSYSAQWDVCMGLGFNDRDNSFEDNDDLSFFERVEEKICNHETSLDFNSCIDQPNNERSWSDLGLRPISTQFCSAGSDLQSHSSIIKEENSSSSEAGNKKNTINVGNPEEKTTPVSPASLKRQSSMMSYDSDVSITSSTKRGWKKKRSTR